MGMARRWLDLGATGLAAVSIAVAGFALHREDPGVRPDEILPDVSSVSGPAADPTTPDEDASATGGTRIVDRDAVIGIRLDQTVTTETARVHDLVTAQVSRDVVVDHRPLIPAGTRFEGLVTLVERGRAGGQRRIGICFNDMVLPDGTRVPIHTDTIFRERLSAGSSFTVKLTETLRWSP